MNSLVAAYPSWRRVLEILPPNVVVVDDEGVICHVAESVAELTRHTSEELRGLDVRSWAPTWHLDARDVTSDARKVLATRLLDRHAIDLKDRDAQRRAVDAFFLPLALEGKAWIVAAMFDGEALRHESAREVREREVESRLHAAGVVAELEERFRHAFDDNMAPMMMTDLDDCILAVNNAFCQMIGWTREELMGRDSTSFTYPEDLGISEVTHHRLTSEEVSQARYTKRYLHKDGRVVIVEISKSTARDVRGNKLYFVISERDVTEERMLSAQLSHQALHDPLTGLANRAVFEDRLSLAHARVRRLGGLGAVLLIDLDDFKGVNDMHGHLVGDQLLKDIAERLEQETRSSDTLCRFGGDEFLYLAEGLNSSDEAEFLALRLLEVLAKPMTIAATQLEVHASIGVVIWDGDTVDHSEIVRNADSAMYEAKRRGKGHHVVFTPSLQQQAVSRFALTQELRHALSVGQLTMHYQPILDLATLKVVGFEALMRWQHPERGAVPPNVFITLAEQSSLILELGILALRESVTAASQWTPADPHAAPPFVTVNLSSRQFRDPELVPSIVASLMESGLDPERLVIEITESTTLLDIAETLSVIEQLNRLGIGIALDDFGTGYSSLSYLTLLRPKIIKIDQSFVSPPHPNVQNDTLLETIVSLGQKLNMTVLAEGIETEPQLQRLRELGCHLGQGYLFTPAVPQEEALRLVGQTMATEKKASSFSKK
ncbi:MAG: diguanylate cyclase/phosphodiesterase with sensor(s) [Acidimicrobiaceae bacterium]|nr:diguanylate cyclase/phosphodiesterase with sensor(s) [Acidimicrobiaceae bacterium]